MHHSFDINLAVQYGCKEALIIQRLQVLVGLRKKLDSQEDRSWVHLNMEEFCSYFSYLSRDEITQILKNLYDGGKYPPVLMALYEENNNKKIEPLVFAFVDEERFVKGMVA